MSAPPLVEAMGARLALSGEGVGVIWRGALAAFATGEAEVAFVQRDGRIVNYVRDAHQGALLCAIPGQGGALLTGGDDGRVLSVDVETGAREVARFEKAWIDAIAAAPGFIAVAVGKDAVLLKPDGAVIHRFEHEARVSGLAFEPNGRRLAAAHYGGATISWASNPSSRRKTLAWKGAHLSALWSPDARFLLTTMQENALHGWKLQDGSHFRMAGYPAKVKSLSFSADGRWLASAGAPEVVCWPFAGPTGPVGKEGMVAGEMSETVTAVACHPARPVVAAGAADGEVAIFPLGGAGGGAPRPVLVDRLPGQAVTAIAWSADGAGLAWIGADGAGGIVDLGAHL